MAAEELRGVRIMLLKITHLPYVAAIWFFESTQDKLKHNGSGRHLKRNGWQSVLKPQNSVNLGNEYGLSGLAVTPPASKDVLGGLQAPPRTVNDLHQGGKTGDELHAELKESVNKLSAQIVELKKQLSRQGEDSNNS